MDKLNAIEDHWTTVIKPRSGLFDIGFRELWDYRDLLFLLVKRDFVAFYKQTILGPIWFVVQPVLTTIMYYLVFGRIANLPTDGVPPVLFYLSGVTCWLFISETLLKTSDTFITNSNIFGKVYFPRLLIPISIVFSSFIKFAVQFILFLLVWAYYMFFTPTVIKITPVLALLPFVLLVMSLLSLGLGIIFSSLTTKYRDLRFLLTFGIQLMMYATPVIYPLSMTSAKYRPFIIANPFTALIETFRFSFTGAGQFSIIYLAYSVVMTLVIITIGIVIFNKIEKSFMDTL